MMYVKEEIIEKIGGSATEVTEWLTQQATEKFTKGPKSKWNTSQHLDHLHQVVLQLNRALLIPKFLLRWRFGKPNRPGRKYKAIVARYQEKLSLVKGNLTPPGGKKHSVADKPKMIENFQLQIQRMQKGLEKWTEEELDQYLIPHPLLGKMTVREILMWMVYHHYHHLNNLKTNY